MHQFNQTLNFPILSKYFCPFTHLVQTVRDQTGKSRAAGFKENHALVKICCC